MLKKITLGIRIIIRLMICAFLIIILIAGLHAFLNTTFDSNTKANKLSNIVKYMDRGEYGYAADWLFRMDYSDYESGELDKYIEFCKFYTDYTRYNMLKMSDVQSDELSVLLEQMKKLSTSSKYDDLVPHYEKLLKNACN